MILILVTTCVHAAAAFGSPAEIVDTFSVHADAYLQAKLRTMRARRRLKAAPACAWEQGKCDISPEFGKKVSRSMHQPELTKLWTEGAACEAAKSNATCRRVPHCKWSSSDCVIDMTREYSAFRELYSLVYAHCGSFGIIGEEALVCQSNKLESACTGNCIWQPADPDQFGMVNETCASVPTPGTCARKYISDSTWLCGVKFKKVEADCAKKTAGITDPAKKKEANEHCKIEACPILALLFGGPACAKFKSHGDCSAAAWFCDWSTVYMCSVDMPTVLDRALPNDCIIKPMLEANALCQVSQDSCKADPSCAWSTHSECDRLGPPTEVEYCGISDELANTQMTDMFGVFGDKFALEWEQKQAAACGVATTPAGCAQVVEVAQPKHADDGKGQKFPMVVIFGVVIGAIVMLGILAVAGIAAYKAINRTKVLERGYNNFFDNE